MDQTSDKTKSEMKEVEEERHKHLVMIGNVLHSSVPISNNEVKGELENEINGVDWQRR